MNKKQNDRVYCNNRKARHDYEISVTYEAGIILRGTEVKSIREGKISLEGSYARIQNGEVYLCDCDIQKYDHRGDSDHDPKRDRKLLLHRREIRKIAQKVEQAGTTLVPLSLYSVNGRFKLKLAIARGKKLYDKRQALKKRQAEREISNVVR